MQSIIINQFFSFNLFFVFVFCFQIRSQLNLVRSGTGVLVSGCPYERRRHAWLGPRRDENECSTPESDDPTLNELVLDQVCSVDAAEDSGLARAVAYSVSALNSMRRIDVDTFARAAHSAVYSESSIFALVLFVILSRFF